MIKDLFLDPRSMGITLTEQARDLNLVNLGPCRI